MRFAPQTVTRVAKIGAALSVLAALAAGVLLFTDMVRKSSDARHMLANGVVVAAVPTYVGSSTTKRRGGVTTTYTVRYAFQDSHSVRHDGSYSPSEREFNTFRDSSRPGMVRRDARVEVIYDPADPSKHGPKAMYESWRSPDFGGAAGGAVVIVLVLGLFITWRVYAFMKKRLAVEPAMPLGPVWRRVQRA